MVFCDDAYCFIITPQLGGEAVVYYLLLRRHIDSSEMDEVALDQNEPEQGLPELTPDDSGIPQVDRKAESPRANREDSDV